MLKIINTGVKIAIEGVKIADIGVKIADIGVKIANEGVEIVVASVKIVFLDVGSVVRLVRARNFKLTYCEISRFCVKIVIYTKVFIIKEVFKTK